jgi:hypothetical protein
LCCEYIVAQCRYGIDSDAPRQEPKHRLQTCPALCQDFLAQAAGCPATPQAVVRSGDARNLTARMPFKSAARPADPRGPSPFACPSSRASSRCASSGALRRRDGKAVSHLHCAAFASPHSLDQRTGYPEYLVPVLCRWSASFARQLLQFASFRPASSPSVCVNGNRETQREGFKPFGFTRSVASFVTG